MFWALFIVDKPDCPLSSSFMYWMYTNLSFSIFVFAVVFPIRPGKGLLSFGSFTYHGLWGYSVILGLTRTVPVG